MRGYAMTSLYYGYFLRRILMSFRFGSQMTGSVNSISVSLRVLYSFSLALARVAVAGTGVNEYVLSAIMEAAGLEASADVVTINKSNNAA